MRQGLHGYARIMRKKALKNVKNSYIFDEGFANYGMT